MSEQSGALDGIKDIVQPAMPLLTDSSIYFIAVMIIVVIGLPGVLLIYYRRLPRVRAKRLYRYLKKSWPDLQAQQCGQMVMSILRLSQGQYNLNEKSYPEQDITLSRTQWRWLMQQSNQLRFSVGNNKSTDTKEILLLLEQVLWPEQ